VLSVAALHELRKFPAGAEEARFHGFFVDLQDLGDLRGS
jgi:hypothetical protein